MQDFMHASKPKSAETLVGGFWPAKGGPLYIFSYFTFTGLKPHAHPKVFLKKFYTSREPLKRRLSFFYNLLQDKTMFLKTTMMLKCEGDPHTPFTPNQ